MKDIKTLYLFARSGKSPDDIKNYCEAVDNMFNNNLYEYVSNLEYIIPSGYGIKTFRKFIENNNIPIIAYEHVMETLDDAIKKYSVRNLASIYKEHVDYDECKRLLKSFKEEYKNSFMMFEAFYNPDISYDNYIQLYYKGYFESNVPEVLTQFGEAAIPDVIISSVKNDRVDITFKFLSEAVESSEGIATYYQWLSEATKDIKNPSDKLELMKHKFTEESLEGIVKSIKLKNAILYKESVVMDTNMYIEYTEEDIQHMQDYIAFKEYYMTTLNDFDEIQNIQNQIISVYEEFDGLIDEDAVDLIEMLPSAGNRMTSEATANKKYGDVPTYLKKHHDLSYGEDDTPETKIDDDPVDHSSIQDYVRHRTPSVSHDDEPVLDYQPTTHTIDNKVDGANNYYYTYNNSFNKTRDSHDSLQYTVNGEKSDGINEDAYDPVLIDNEIELILLESSEFDTFLTENTATMAMGSVKQNNETIIEKLKKLIKRVVEFLQKMWDSVIPKTIIDFIKLEKKILQSPIMVEYLKDNDNILPIQVIDVNNMDIWKRLIDDAESLLKTSMVNDNINYDQLQNKDQIIIFFKLYESNGKDKGMFMIGSSRLYKNSKFKNIGFDKKALFSMSSRPLTNDNLFDILTGASEGIIGTDFNSYRKFKSLLKTLEHITTTTQLAEIINKNKYGDGAAILKRMLEELTILSKTVHSTMVSSYRSAVSQLNTVNKTYTSKSHDNTKQESAPWELDIFPRTESLYESASQASWQKYHKVENESFEKIAGSILKDITSYFDDNVEKTIKGNPRLKYLDDPNIIKEIKTAGKQYSDLIGNAEYLVFNGNQEYRSLRYKYFETELWETDKIGNFLIADLFLLMMKQFILDNPKYIEYFDIPLKYKGWLDKSDDIPGITISVKEPAESIRIKIGSNKFKFKTDAWVPKDAQIESAMSQVVASRLLYFMNKSKIEDSEVGKEILEHLKKYNSTLTEDNLPEYVSADTICFKPQGVIEFTFVDKSNKGRKITIDMNPSLKLQKMNVFNESFLSIFNKNYDGTKNFTKDDVDKNYITILDNTITKIRNIMTGAYTEDDAPFSKFRPSVTDKDFMNALNYIFNDSSRYLGTITKNKSVYTGSYLISAVIMENELIKHLKTIDNVNTLTGGLNAIINHIINNDIFLKSNFPMRLIHNEDPIGFEIRGFISGLYTGELWWNMLKSVKTITESPGNAIIESTDNNDPEKPISDHPIRDTLTDIDRKLTSKQQEAKKTTQAIINTGKVFIKPAQRTVGWIDSIANQWKDKNENDIKERMADPRARKSLYGAIKKAIEIGSLFKARLLFNPIFMFLAITKKISNSKNSFRIRNEMIGELKAEIEIIDEKIKDADTNRDNTAKYKLMRLKTEINKKLLRVDGGKAISRIL